MDGWHGDAIDRYNDLMELVITDRETYGEHFDEFYKQHLKQKNDHYYDKLERKLARSRPRKRARVIMPAGIVAGTLSTSAGPVVPDSVEFDHQSVVRSVSASQSTLSATSRSGNHSEPSSKFAMV